MGTKKGHTIYRTPISGLKWVFLFISLTTGVQAQPGGKKSYEFLNVPATARLVGLGGVNVSYLNKDINFFHSNPALVGDTLAGWGSAGYQFYVADIGQATFSYVHRFKKIGALNFGIQHMGYGTINGYDPSGADLGDFKSGETVLVIGKSHQIGNFSMGINLKPTFSSVAGYYASALMVDLGGTFLHPKKDFVVGMVIRNVGFVIADYTTSSNSKLPFDVQLGVTFKPEHMPLRFSVTAYQLMNSDVNNATPTNDISGVDKVIRHFNFGAEILVHKKVNLLVGYNYMYHQDLKLQNGGGGAGISFGMVARSKFFEFVFSRGGYVAGSAGYSLTLLSNFNNLLTRR